MKFSDPPKASELRMWARACGFVKLPESGDGYSTPETWVDSAKRWRLKIKRPATRPGLESDSYRDRFSCREMNPLSGELEYFDPVEETFGTRRILGHLALQIDQPTPKG